MKEINGILLIYHHTLGTNAATIMEHVNAFEKYSHFKIWKINTELGFPRYLWHLKFKVILLHYSLFGTGNYRLNKKYRKYLQSCIDSYKICFFQDEYHFCQQRFQFINQYKINCVYTLLDPAYYKEVYLKYTSVSKLVHTLTGYVSDELVEISRKMSIPYEKRKIDVGYRGRELPYYMGKGAQEKSYIAHEFKKRASELGLKLDIETKENRRLYGYDWYNFLANCRSCLGVEAGVSIYDIEDTVKKQYDEYIRKNPLASFDEVYKEILIKWEDNIPYRTISPRHFEAAAFKICQILFEGSYSNILKPMIHYIPLKKDFSNFDEVIDTFFDKEKCKKIIENAYNDLIKSEKYTYKSFVNEFDEELKNEGIISDISNQNIKIVDYYLYKDYQVRFFFINVKYRILITQFPGRKYLIIILKKVFKLFKLMK
jgi:hypothetical protein